jgi:nitrogen fixation NifU-like protein
MSSDYSDKVMDHFRNPRNAGQLARFNGRGVAGNPNAGPFMVVYLQVQEEVVRDASFETFGCAAAIASGSLMTDHIRGQPIATAVSMNADWLLQLLGGLPLGKEHCAQIAVAALAEALRLFHEGQNHSPDMNR